jgi:hypothetical protein
MLESIIANIRFKRQNEKLRMENENLRENYFV